MYVCMHRIYVMCESVCIYIHFVCLRPEVYVLYVCNDGRTRAAVVIAAVAAERAATTRATGRFGR